MDIVTMKVAPAPQEELGDEPLTPLDGLVPDEDVPSRQYFAKGPSADSMPIARQSTSSAQFLVLLQVKEKSRSAEDFRPIRRGRSVTVEWVCEALGVDFTAASAAASELPSAQEAVDAAVVGAVEGCQLQVLKWLNAQRAWKPQTSDLALRAADEAGTLVVMLQHFELPLSDYPNLAPFYRDEVTEMLAAVAPPEDDGWDDEIGSVSNEANLLANYVLVPNPIADEVLNAMVEEMVIFRTFGRKDNPLNVPFPAAPAFPHFMGAFYLRRLVTERMAKEKRPRYDRDKQLVDLRSALPAFTRPLKTSPESRLTLPKTDRAAALIPVNTARFVYVYDGEGLDTGGFMYMNDKGDILAVNGISFTSGRNALRLGEAQTIDEKSGRSLRGKGQPVSVPVLLDMGVLEYIWVGPDVTLEGGFNSGLNGGFAYLFKAGAEHSHCFFPVSHSGEVADRADLSWEVNARLMEHVPRPIKIEEKITKTSNGAVGGTPITLARLKVRYPLNAVVLHALARCPRESVLSTWAAKAISTAAFQRARRGCVIEITLQLFSLTGITGITKEVRDTGEVDLSKTLPWFYYCLVVIMLTKNLLVQVTLFIGYRRRRWTAHYFNLKRVVTVGRIWIMIMLCTAIAFGKGERRDQALRPLLAVAGASKWAQVLWMLRGFQIMRLGMRILPIFHALLEVVSFLFFMVFCMLMFWQASFALNLNESHYLFLGTYRLAFLGDWDMQKDVLDLEEDESVTNDWIAGWQYAGFVLGTLVMAVTLTNIFIGVMSSAFDYHQERVVEHFVRQRACIGVDYELREEVWGPFMARWGCRRRRDPRDHLWFCFPQQGEDEDKESPVSLRSSLHMLQENVVARIKKLTNKHEDSMSKLNKRIDSIEAVINELRA